MRPNAQVYLDTSAYLALLLGDPRAELVQTRIKDQTVVSSVMLLIEAERNLLRLYRERMLSLDIYEKALSQLRKDSAGMVLLDVTFDLALTGMFPAARLPRSNDLVHLRTALWFLTYQGLTDFITFDGAQLAAARELRIPGDWDLKS